MVTVKAGDYVRIKKNVSMSAFEYDQNEARKSKKSFIVKLTNVIDEEQLYYEYDRISNNYPNEYKWVRVLNKFPYTGWFDLNAHVGRAEQGNADSLAILAQKKKSVQHVLDAGMVVEWTGGTAVITDVELFFRRRTSQTSRKRKRAQETKTVFISIDD